LVAHSRRDARRAMPVWRFASRQTCRAFASSMRAAPLTSSALA
jgi:hypothetical protein